MRVLMAGDMATADGGVGGIGDISFFAATRAGSSGMTRGANVLRKSNDALEDLLMLRELRCLLIPFA